MVVATMTTAVAVVTGTLVAAEKAAIIIIL